MWKGMGLGASRAVTSEPCSPTDCVGYVISLDLYLLTFFLHPWAFFVCQPFQPWPISIHIHAMLCTAKPWSLLQITGTQIIKAQLVITHMATLALSSPQCLRALPWDQDVTTASVPGTDTFLSLLDWSKEGSRGLAYSEAWQWTRRRRTPRKAKHTRVFWYLGSGFLPATKIPWKALTKGSWKYLYLSGICCQKRWSD